MLWRSSFNSLVAQIADFLTSLVGYALSYSLWTVLHSNFSMFPAPSKFSGYFIFWSLISCYLYVFLFQKNKAYSFQRFTSLYTEFSIVLKVVSIGTILSLTFSFFLNLADIRRTFFVLLYGVLLLLFLIQKTFMFYFAQQIRKQGRNRKKVLVVGFGRKLTDFINAVRRNFNWGLDIIGVVIDDSGNGTKEIAGKKVLGKYSQIEEILKNYNPEEVIIAIPSDHLYKIKQIIYHCEKAGMNVRLVSDFFYYLEKRVTIDNVFGQNIISFQGVNQNQLELFIKRLIDIVVSFVLLVLLLPFFLVISLIILFQDGRPIFYRWKVMGKNRKPITSWKFRTMVKNADEIKEKLKKANEMQGPVFKLTHDPRILPFGRFLRRYSLDELPQLFSVLKGDLSLVGPRPPLQSEFKEFELWHRRKLSVKPGLTCLWQVSGRNSIKNFDDWARLDLEYIDNWNLWLDFKILLKTIPAVIKGTGK